jgi:hypothetical protein
MKNKLFLVTLSVGALLAALLAISPAASSAACTPPYCPSHTLKVNKGGNGSGTVTSSPAGIKCGKTCTASYEEGTTVTLTATAAPGSTFTKWAGAGCSGTGTCVVTIERKTTVTAVFHAHPPRPSAHVNTKRNGTAKATIRLPQPGKIKIWGHSIRAAYINARHKGKFTRTLRPKGRVKQHLDNRGWTRPKRIFIIYTQGSKKTKVKSVVRFRDKR